MAITVANLIAQVGADLTQFKLGMNEVDARLNQVKVRGDQARRTVEAMRLESARQGRIADNLLAQRAAVNPQLADARRMLRAQRDIAADYQRIWESAEAARVAAASTGNKTLIASSKATAQAAARDLADIRGQLSATEAEYRTLQSQARSLGRRGIYATQKAEALNTRANAFEDATSAANGVAAAIAMRRQQDAAEHRTRAFNNIAGTAATGGLVVEGALGYASKVGADFNQMMLQAAHNTQLTTEGVQVMNATVKQLGLESGASLEELAHGFRMLTDYGFTATQSQQMLRAAMKGAVATGSDLADTTLLLAKATKEFNLPANESNKTMAAMVATARRTSLTMGDLVHAAGPLYATAANLGVSFTEANAAFVTFTQHGLDGAQAATQLRNDINKIINPSKTVRDLLKELDKYTGSNLFGDFNSVGLRARHIEGIVDDVMKAFDRLTDKQKKALNVEKPADLAVKLFPNLRGTVGASILEGTGYQDLHKNIDALNSSLGKGGEIDKMYAESLKNLNQQLGRLQNAGTMLAATVANALTPSLTKAMGAADNAIQSFTELPNATQEATVKFVALAGISLILFGTVGKLIVGVSQLKTAMVELGVAEEALASKALLARFGPWGIVIAAIVTAVGLLVGKYGDLQREHVITRAELDKLTEKSDALTKAHYDNAVEVRKLVVRYKELASESGNAHKRHLEMHDILQRLAQIAPELVSGYNKEGEAISLMGDAAEKSAAQLRDLTLAQIAVNESKNIKDKVTLAGGDTDANGNVTVKGADQYATDIARVKWSLTHGLVPRRGGDGMWKWKAGGADPADIASGNPYVRQTTNTFFNNVTGSQTTEPYMRRMTAKDRADYEAYLNRLLGLQRRNKADQDQVNATLQQEAKHRREVVAAYKAQTQAQADLNRAIKAGKDTAKARARLAKADAALALATDPSTIVPDLGNSDSAYKGVDPTIAPPGHDDPGGKHKKEKESPFQQAMDAAREKLDQLRQAYNGMYTEGDAADVMWDRQHGQLKLVTNAMYAQVLAQAKLNDETRKYLAIQSDIDAAQLDQKRQAIAGDAGPNKNVRQLQLELFDPKGKYAHAWNMAGNPSMDAIRSYMGPLPQDAIAPMPVGLVNGQYTLQPGTGVSRGKPSGKFDWMSMLHQLFVTNAHADNTDFDKSADDQMKSIADAVGEPAKKEETPQQRLLALIAQNKQAAELLKAPGDAAMDIFKGGKVGTFNANELKELQRLVNTGEDAAHALADLYAERVKNAEAATKHKEETAKEAQQAKDAADFLNDSLRKSKDDLLKAKGGDDAKEGAWSEFLAGYEDKQKDRWDAASPQQRSAMEAEARALFELVWANQQAAKAARELNDINKRVNEGLKDINSTMSHTVDGIVITDAQWNKMSKDQQNAFNKLKKMAEVKKLLTDIMDGMEQIVYNSLMRIREHGFKGIFSEIVQDFDQMLYELAAKWLASQFYNMLINQIPKLMGMAFGAAGGGGGDSTGGGIGAGGGDIAGTTTGSTQAAVGAPVEKGRSYLVGENRREYLTVDGAGNMWIRPDTAHPGRTGGPGGGSGGGGDVHLHQHITVMATDARSFSGQRTQSQIQERSAAAARMALNRNR